MATVISADEIKKQIPNYTPNKAEVFHRESAKLADKLFSQELKKTKYKNIILLNGGTASGKSEFLSTQLKNKRCLVFDATLSTELGAEIKLKQIFKAKKKAVIYTIISDDLKRSFIAFLSRDRKFSDSHFYKTHSGSRKTILWIAENYPQVRINIIESSYTLSQVLQFTKIEFAKRQQLIEYLRSIQMTENDIITSIIKV